MRAISFFTLAVAFVFGSSSQLACAHLIGDRAHDGGTAKYDFSIKPPMGVVLHEVDSRPGVVVAPASLFVASAVSCARQSGASAIRTASTSRTWTTSPEFPGLVDDLPAGEPMDHPLFPVLRG